MCRTVSKCLVSLKRPLLCSSDVGLQTLLLDRSPGVVTSLKLRVYTANRLGDLVLSSNWNDLLLAAQFDDLPLQVDNALCTIWDDALYIVHVHKMPVEVYESVQTNECPGAQNN